MKTVRTLLLCSAIILNSIGMSSQSRRLTDEAHHPDRSQRPAERTARARSRSPTLRETFPGVLGYRFEELEFIRLSPYCSPNRVFELRTYVIPPDKPIGFRTCPGVLKPIPASERIVLSTSNGDVCAILDRRSRSNICLRGIVMDVSGKPVRAKINMNTGAVKRLTGDESDECPVSTQDQIAKNYAISRVDTAIPNTGSSSRTRDHSGPSSSSSSRRSPQTTRSLARSHPSIGSPPPFEPNLLDESRPPPLRQTFASLFGYRFKDLKSIRLSPHNYPNRIYRLRIYAFPSDKPIGLRTKHYTLNPMPTGDQIVLTTSNGDVYAILQKKLNKSMILRPIFTSNLGVSERVKINMNSGEVEELSTEENEECPVTFREAITKSYRVFNV